MVSQSRLAPNHATTSNNRRGSRFLNGAVLTPLASGDEQFGPGFVGSVSVTAVTPNRKHNIDIFTPLNQPFTDYAVV